MAAELAKMKEIKPARKFEREGMEGANAKEIK